MILTIPPQPPRDADTLAAEVERRRPWFHHVHLPHGVVTPGTREPNAWEWYHLPARLDGQRVLDIGAWEGQFSFAAEQRGANRVVAMDLWGNDPAHGEPGSMGQGWDNFAFCHSVLASRVEPLHKNVYDLAPSDGPFDLILFLEVLYHLQHPLLGLQRIAAALAPGGLLCMETWIDAEWIETPAAMFYPGAELNGDPTNWWGPNIKCVQAMAAAVGFARCDLVWSRDDVHFGGRGKRACFHARKETA